jgi:sortase A
VVPDLGSPTLGELRADYLTEEEEQTRKPRRRKVFDAFLLVVEVLAVFGLVFVLFNGLEVIQELNQEVADALELPTLTPIPLPTWKVAPDSIGRKSQNI